MINRNVNQSRAKITPYLGVENRKEALRGATFVVNAIQVGGYEPCTVVDFEIPKKYGLRQTIGDTLGIGGIMRALRTIPVMEGFGRDMEEVCPDTLFLNYSNPMAMLTGYMLRYTGVKTVGLCHSVQVCTSDLFKGLGMEDKLEGCKELIAGINHMGWLLKIQDRDGNDLYPEIRRRAKEKNSSEVHDDMVRYDYRQFVSQYGPVIKAIAAGGLQFMYHNHSDEFKRLPNGNHVLEQMCRDFAPEELGITADTFWMQVGGVNPAEWLERLTGRVPCIHLKDYMMRSWLERDVFHYFAPIGEGNINFDAVFQAAEKAGTQYMLVEQDDSYGEDPFACLRRSYEFLHSKGFD